ncbi:hypothetical protein QOT17_021787 [Balamuthia mandrillaris]
MILLRSHNIRIIIKRQRRSITYFEAQFLQHITADNEIAAPLEPLQNVPDIRPYWNNDCQQALGTFKHIITSLTILSAPDWDKPFHADTDTSLHGVGRLPFTNTITLALKLKINNIKLDDSQLSAFLHILNDFVKDLLSKTVPPPNEHQQILEQLHFISHEDTESLLNNVLKEGYF